MLRTRWALVPYSEYNPLAHNYIMGGDVIRLSHPEAFKAWGLGGEVIGGWGGDRGAV